MRQSRCVTVLAMNSTLRTIVLTAVALIAFAGNSFLCRAALLGGAGGHADSRAIDPLSFTAIRIGSGVLVLLPILVWANAQREVRTPLWPGRRGLIAGLVMVTYAVPFSLSYVTVPTGVGALILFGTVQLTMLATARFEGERLGVVRSFGALIAFSGLCVLLAPSASSIAGVDPAGAALMVVAGVCWGAYTLLGRGSKTPTLTTAQNFIAAFPVALLLWLPAESSITPRGAWLAAASGALCSGLGYTIWYLALRGHTAVSASIAQLLVPILAAALGALFLGEEVTQTLVVSSVLVVSGVALASKRTRP